MGYYKRSNSNITDFKPDDTETTLFLECNYDQYSILDIVNRLRKNGVIVFNLMKLKFHQNISILDVLDMTAMTQAIMRIT